MIFKADLITNPVQFLGFLMPLCFLFVLIVLNGCSVLPNETELYSSPLANEVCAPPCWNNITPGVSTEDDVRRQLDSSLVQIDYSLTEREGVPLSVFSWQSSSGKGGWIYLRDGQVLWIYIGLERELTLGEIVDEYGPPESTYASLLRSGYLRYHIAANYPAQGMQFSTSLHPCNPDVADCESSVVLSEDVIIVLPYSICVVRENHDAAKQA